MKSVSFFFSPKKTDQDKLDRLFQLMPANTYQLTPSLPGSKKSQDIHCFWFLRNGCPDFCPDFCSLALSV